MKDILIAIACIGSAFTSGILLAPYVSLWIALISILLFTFALESGRYLHSKYIIKTKGI